MQKGDHYKTIDLSQLDRNKTKMDNHSTFLLKDASKFDPASNSYISSGMSLTTHMRENKSQHTLVNNLWNNQQLDVNNNSSHHNSTSLFHRDATIVEGILANTNLDTDRVNVFLQNTDDMDEEEAMKLNANRRFTIEKIKDLV